MAALGSFMKLLTSLIHLNYPSIYHPFFIFISGFDINVSELISCMSYRVDLSVMGNVIYSKDFKTQYDAENKTPLTQNEGSIHKLH